MQTDLDRPLNEDELELLDNLIASRFSEIEGLSDADLAAIEDVDAFEDALQDMLENIDDIEWPEDEFTDDLEDFEDEGDIGLLDVSQLDGFLTAIVSLPMMIMPSQWWPMLWGDYPPEFESLAEFEQLSSLIFRHMNSIANELMQQPEYFEPMFNEHEVKNRTYMVVDEWCEGYMQAVGLAMELGLELDNESAIMLHPIRAFTEAEGWPGHDLPGIEETENLQQSIVQCVRELQGHWLAQRQPLQPGNEPFRRAEARVGRNDPCHCGSGKKFKKCCLH
jgi:uncharacterized protein